jgi:hypothetical protein
MPDSDPHIISVPLETASGEGLNRIFDEVAFKAVVTNLQQVKADYQAARAQESQKINQLQDELLAAETVRARLIHELRLHYRQLNDELREQNNELREQNIEQKNELRGQNNSLRGQNNALRGQNNALMRELDYLSTSKAAIRHLLKAVLRKLHLFNFIYNRYQSFVPIYTLIFRDRWAPATIAAAKSAESEEQSLNPASPAIEPAQLLSNKDITSRDAVDVPNIDMKAPHIEALVVARHLGLALDAPTGTLEFLTELITSSQNVLCLEPTPQIIPLLQSLAKNNAKVTCVGCRGEDVNELGNYGLEAIAQSLGDWMIATDTMSFCDYDVVCLNRQSSTDDLRLLKGRLSTKTRVIASGNTIQNG